MNKLQLILLLFFALISCDNKKEKQLELREQQLFVRESLLMARESEYNELVRLRDSLQNEKLLATRDTVAKLRAWPVNFQQSWNSKMICRESNCSNYVIGDQRNEVWKFISDSTGLYMNVINNDKLVRVFNANYTKELIMLEYNADTTATTKMKIKIVLDDIQSKVIKGNQIISGKDNCAAKFSVELTPSTK